MELFLFAFLLQLVSQIIFFVSWLFPFSVAMRSSLLDDILWKWKKVHRKFDKLSIGLCFFLQEMPACAIYDAYVSSMIGMLCTAFWDPSRAIQTIRCCSLPESFSLILDLMGPMLDFVVDLVEKRVDLGGSQLSETILERWYSAHASQHNVVILEFGSPSSPRSTLFAHDLNRHGWQRVAPISHEVFCLQRWMFRFHEKNVFENYLAHFLCLFQQRVSSFFHVPFQRWDPYCLQMNVLGLH